MVWSISYVHDVKLFINSLVTDTLAMWSFIMILRSFSAKEKGKPIKIGSKRTKKSGKKRKRKFDKRSQFLVWWQDNIWNISKLCVWMSCCRLCLPSNVFTFSKNNEQCFWNMHDANGIGTSIHHSIITSMWCLPRGADWNMFMYRIKCALDCCCWICVCGKRDILRYFYFGKIHVSRLKAKTRFLHWYANFFLRLDTESQWQFCVSQSFV